MKLFFKKISSIFTKLRVWGIKGVVGYFPRWFASIRIKHFLCKNARQHLGTTPERGITVIAPISRGYSNSKTVRDFLFALKRAGIPFQGFDINPAKNSLTSDYLDVVTPRHDFNVRRFTHVVEMFRSPLPDGIVPVRARIAFWEGESGLLETFPYLASSNPVIAMSDFNFNDFCKELPKTTKIFKILYPLQEISKDLEDKKIICKRYGFGEDDFIVFYNFDLGSFHRKNPLAAIKSFSRVLRGVANARLVFKVNLASDYPNHIETIKRCVEEEGISSQFTIISGYLSRREIYSLTNACDVYLSLHRAEGFGIGMAEAMQLGKVVIATDYSASTEFCLPSHSIPIPYTLVDIKPGEYFLSMKRWAEADISVASEAILRCYNDMAYRTRLGKQAKIFIDEYFSTENFKKSVCQFLDAI